MKKEYTLNIMLIITMLICISQLKAHTNTDMKDKYRLTAYKNGNSKVVSVSNEVEVTPAKVYYMPNAFSPNGDGLNETFGLVGDGITEYNFQIYNRWGNLVFVSNELYDRWDGTYNNEAVPEGIYVYKIIGKGNSGNGDGQTPIDIHGTVTLVL